MKPLFHFLIALFLLVMPASPLSSIPAMQAEHDITLSCPNCHSLMHAKFKKGYTSTTKATCKKCYKSYIIHYNWPATQNEPTIRKIEKS